MEARAQGFEGRERVASFLFRIFSRPAERKMVHETRKAHLSSPHTLDSLGQTDIIRLELV
jgi:hypothetical protein